MNNLLLLIVAAVLAASCTSTDEPVGPLAPDFPGALIGEWGVQAIEGTPVVANSPAYVGFDADGSVHGNSSCNRMSGTWELDGLQLRLSPLAVTRMAGPPELMDQEQRLLSALERVAGVGMDGESLILSSADGTELIRAGRRDA